MFVPHAKRSVTSDVPSREELSVRADLLVIDGLYLRDFDYVDIGRVRYPSTSRTPPPGPASA